MDYTQLGERLRIARQRKNMSQIDVAVALEEFGIQLNQTAIGKIERGERNIYLHHFVALLDVLDISYDWAINGGDINIP